MKTTLEQEIEEALELYRGGCNSCNNVYTEQAVRKIINGIKKIDKEFIEELKKRICNGFILTAGKAYICEVIDKLCKEKGVGE